MKRYFLRQFLGCGKSEFNEVSLPEWNNALSVYREDMDFGCFNHFPEFIDEFTVHEVYLACYNNGFEEWETEIGFTVGSDDLIADLGDSDWFNLGELEN